MGIVKQTSNYTALKHIFTINDYLIFINILTHFKHSEIRFHFVYSNK